MIVLSAFIRKFGRLKLKSGDKLRNLEPPDQIGTVGTFNVDSIINLIIIRSKLLKYDWLMNRREFFSIQGEYYLRLVNVRCEG